MIMVIWLDWCCRGVCC